MTILCCRAIPDAKSLDHVCTKEECLAKRDLTCKHLNRSDGEGVLTLVHQVQRPWPVVTLVVVFAVNLRVYLACKTNVPQQ